MNELITVPSTLFYQGNPDWCGESENPIQINFYNGTVELKQGNNSVIIADEEIDKLLKVIKKNRVEADKYLNM